MTKKVALLVAHGGKDPGARAFGYRESDVSLDICLRTASHLRQLGIEPYLTRTKDVYISPEEQARMANRWGVHLAVSPHLNAGGGTGFESYVHPNAGQETRRIRRIIHSRLAEHVGRLGIRDRGEKEANFAVLRVTKMPAVLLELCFIDSKKDVDALVANPDRRESVALVLAMAIADALGVTRVTSKGEDDVDTIVRRLVDRGITNSPDYWRAVLRGEKPANPEYLRTILSRLVS